MDDKGGIERRRVGEVIRELASRQHQVVATRQLGRAGVSRTVIGRLVRDGWLHRVHRGIYAVGRAELTYRGRCMAGVLFAGPRSAISHTSAAALHGLCRPPRGPIHLVSSSNRRSTAGVRVHRQQSLSASTLGLIDRISVTNLEATLLDLAAAEPETMTRRAFEEAERLRILRLEPLSLACERRRGRPGAPVIAALIAELVEPEFTRSDLEELFRDLRRRYGLPRPVINGHIAGYEVDVHWPDARLALELDSWREHGNRVAFERDRIRDVQIAKAGYRTVRYTWRRLTEAPQEVATELKELLGLGA